MQEHVSGTDTRYTLTASTSRRPSWQEGATLNWFQAATDTLAVRIPLVNPTKEVASVGGYKCPCAACPQCSASTCQSSTVTACCTDPSCADQDLRWVVKNASGVTLLECLCVAFLADRLVAGSWRESYCMALTPLTLLHAVTAAPAQLITDSLFLLILLKILLPTWVLNCVCKTVTCTQILVRRTASAVRQRQQPRLQRNRDPHDG
jgi:hypothetical protein